MCFLVPVIYIFLHSFCEFLHFVAILIYRLLYYHMLIFIIIVNVHDHCC